MKAILVIDMPDEDLKDYFANVEIFKEGVLRFSADDLACPYRLHQRFKPLPQKKDYKLAYKKENYYEIFAKNYVSGFNACLEELLGGNDES